ncbi:MAG TPA: xanthine dehydrogenase family protein molybdopterin-binding subunit [Kofleriaceae bacterium]|nr:xanthine dehydrogenase family protein molybdopterin-binding subunit [Kofleriaceae bacterium]
MKRTLVGASLDRVDGRKKVTGAATYAAEVEVAHVAHAVIVGSTVARGRISAIATRAAQAAPGVIAVLTHRNAPRVPGAAEKQQPNDRLVQSLQDDVVWYQDQPIALVVAQTLERAQHAAGLVTAEYAAVKPVADIDADLAAAFVPEAQNPRSPPQTSRGDVAAGLSAARTRIDATYTTPVETHNPMEPHATIAVWHGSDHLTLYDSTQAIFNVRRRLAGMFGLPPENVRVINHFVGGGFGAKGAPWSHVALAAVAARATGRAVKLAVTRPQLQSLVGHRPRTIQKLQLGADARGRLTAIRHDVVSETSRFDQFIESCTGVTRMLYACPNLETVQRLVRIDVPTPTFTRAPGESTGTFALESALDELAYGAGIDPLELRRRNHADRDPETDKPWSSKSLLQCYRRGAEAIGWSRRRPKVKNTRDGRWLVGLGVATATRPSRQQPASALARMLPDGRAIVQAGTQDIGTGTYTVMTQIAGDALALPMGDVRFELGDTAFPETPPSVGSFTVASTGAAVHSACTALRRKLCEMAIADPASPLHGLKPESIDADDAALIARGDRKRRDGYAAIVTRSGQPEVRIELKTEATKERDEYSVHGFGAVFARVRVDEDLGEVRLDRLVGAFAAGRIINPKTARSQLAGGMVWGIGQALHEISVRDTRTARMVTRDLTDYHVPVHADVPNLEVLMLDEVDPHVNEIGAKGLGELSTPGVAAAIANAVYHATGIRVRDLPITPDKLITEPR